MQSIPHRPTNDQLRALPLADLMAYAHRLCAELARADGRLMDARLYTRQANEVQGELTQ